jgi:lysophospholipase L1-like esterase
MKSRLLLCCLLLCIAAAIGGPGLARADFLIQPNDMLAICGDSITEQQIYTVYMEDYLLMCQPAQGLKVMQFGWGYEQAPTFLKRLDAEIFPFKPTVMTTCYGMDDGNYKAPDASTANTYRTSQIAIVEAMKKAGVRCIVLGSPKCVDTFAYNRSPPADVYNKTLASLSQIDQEVAAKEGVVYADVFGATTSAMEKSKAEFGKEYAFAGPDGIHPGPNGHLVIAYAFLKALGCDGAIGTITVDLDSGHAEGSPGQKVISFQNGAVKLESTRYPFCFQGDPTKKDDSTASILKFVPFNDELNRYMLVVKGLKTPMAKVTWGTESKEYSAADLEKGINLAAEFLNNPFVDQFNKVDAAVKAQQRPEKFLVKSYLHMVPDLKAMAPDETASIDRITAAGMAQDNKLFEAAASLVTPVQHTVMIEPVLAADQKTPTKT